MSVVREARKYLGVPFHHDGRNPKYGLDCAGLLACVLADLRIPFQDVRGYSKIPADGLLTSAIQTIADRVDSMEVGDILTFWMDRGNRVDQHCAIWSGELIHVYYGGRVLEEPMAAVWRRRLIASYRLRG